MKEDIMIILGADLSEEALIERLMKMAEAYIKLYCGINKIDEGFEAVITEITVILYNRLGAEGETRHSEGEISRVFSEGMPKNINAMLERYRRGRVMSL